MGLEPGALDMCTTYPEPAHQEQSDTYPVQNFSAINGISPRDRE